MDMERDILRTVEEPEHGDNCPSGENLDRSSQDPAHERPSRGNLLPCAAGATGVPTRRPPVAAFSAPKVHHNADRVWPAAHVCGELSDALIAAALAWRVRAARGLAGHNRLELVNRSLRHALHGYALPFAGRASSLGLRAFSSASVAHGEATGIDRYYQNR